MKFDTKIDDHLVNDLTLAEINDGKRYKERCHAARLPAPAMAFLFADIAARAAREYEAKKFNDHHFTAQEILAVAARLAHYYTQHVAEGDAIVK